MTYLTSWEEFAKAAERLYLADPSKARFILKYRHCDGKLVVKITDDQVQMINFICWKFRYLRPLKKEEFKKWFSIPDTLLVQQLVEFCLQYLTEHTQDVKKIEKLTSQLMRHMASKEK